MADAKPCVVDNATRIWGIKCLSLTLKARCPLGPRSWVEINSFPAGIQRSGHFFVLATPNLPLRLFCYQLRWPWEIPAGGPTTYSSASKLTRLFFSDRFDFVITTTPWAFVLLVVRLSNSVLRVQKVDQVFGNLTEPISSWFYCSYLFF